MRYYYYTDKLLLILAIANLLMLIPFIGSLWFPILLIHKTQGDTSQMWITFLLSVVEGFLVFLIASYTFFKRWRWIVIVYVLYLSRWVPAYTRAMIQDWKDHVTINFLSSAIYAYFYIFLWFLGLIILILMLIETDYKNLFHRWRTKEIKS